MYGINSTSNAYVLQNLRQINSDLATAQLRIGTGKKINSAADGAAIWAVAEGMKSDKASSDSVLSGITLAKSTADASVAALDTVMNLLYEIQDVALDAYADNNGPYTAYAAKVTALNSQITAALANAEFNDDNWLTGGATAQNVRIGVNDATQTLSLTPTDLDDTGAAMTTFNTAAGVNITTAASGLTLSAAVDTAITALTTYSATLSTFSTALGFQKDFLTTLDGIRSDAISGLVDADLTEESAKVTALQTQQSLAYQALSIGNSSSQNVLRLFQ